jgi:pyrimidine oxygenase
MMGMAAADVNASETSTARQILQDMQNNCMFNINVIAGSAATVARKVDAIAAIEGVAGMMLVFPDFVEGVNRFGTEVMPLLECKK